MPRINVLSKNIAELIAAGEVVERPASVIKELTENAIDAGASSITVEVKNGGISYMRITDNGCGIMHEDVPKAFVSHATSKIKSAEDLDAIYTLGFRGEALASVAAVSKVEMYTKPAEEQNGTLYKINGGVETEYDEAGCPNGTTIVVRDLFYNTPARMKFLKKDVSEANACSDVVDKLALSHPEISFTFIRDGKRTLLTPGDSRLISAIGAVYGAEFADGLIETDYELDGVHVSGYISKPLKSKATRAMQMFYLSCRYIKSRSCTASLENAYKNSIMVGKFPGCVLNITVPAHSVDVNVHPTKTEVRFSDERKIYSAVYYAAKSALDAFDTRPQFTAPKPVLRSADRGVQLTMDERPKKNDNFWTNVSSKEYSHSVTVSSPRNDFSPMLDDSDEPNLISGRKRTDSSWKQPSKEPEREAAFSPKPAEAPLRNIVEELDEEKESNDNFRIIGEAFKTYIICETEGKLFLIDKHAAHERVIFNKLKKRDLSVSRQILLVPQTIVLGKKEYSIVIENLDKFEQSGFLVEDFGNPAIIVRECPPLIDSEDAADIVSEICENLIGGKTDLSSDKIDMILHTTACKAAIKAGNNNSLRELEELAREVINNDEVRYCPHGRPVLIEITKYDLEKQFKRIQ